MDKPNFELAKKCADYARLQQKQELRLNIPELVVTPNIIIDSVQNFASITGRPTDIYMPRFIKGSLKIWDPKNSIHLILYDETQHFPRRIWGVAHELGHTYLGHEVDERTQEVEAHSFAAEFLAPEIALRYVQDKLIEFTDIDIALLFGLSEKAATKRMKYLLTTYPYHTTAEEIELLRILKPQLDNYIASMKSFYTIPLAASESPQREIILNHAALSSVNYDTGFPMNK